MQSLPRLGRAIHLLRQLVNGGDVKFVDHFPFLTSGEDWELGLTAEAVDAADTALLRKARDCGTRLLVFHGHRPTLIVSATGGIRGFLQVRRLFC